MNKNNIREIIKEFKKDFVPLYGPMNCHKMTVSNIRQATDLERCCACICEDSQSGMIYCGDLAETVADVVGHEGCIVAYCEQHRKRMDRHQKAGAR